MISIHRGLAFAAIVGALTLATSLNAASRGQGPLGDWEMMLDFDSLEMPSLLSFSRNERGEIIGEWISLYGVSKLKNIKREGRQLNFDVVTPMGDDVLESRFEGRLAQGRLTGRLSSDEGEIATEGERVKRMPRIAGAWDMAFRIGDQDINTVLLLSTDAEGKLEAEWESPWGEHEITEVSFAKNKLKFSRVSKFEERSFASTFEGTLKGRTLSGMIKSEMGEVSATGKQVGGPLIGKWALTMTSDRGTRKQRLVVYPDMSGSFAGTKIEKMDWQEGQVGFSTLLSTADNDFEISFKGRLARGELSGKITSSWGTSDVVGKKIRQQARRANQAAKVSGAAFRSLGLADFKGAKNDETSVPGGCWVVQDGLILCTPRSDRPEGARGSIVTKAQYAQFDLRLEYKLDPHFDGHVNSGIKYFAYPGTELGLEYQIYDHDKALKGAHSLADLYDLLPAGERPAKPRGQWNKVRIVAQGKHVEHWLNDVKVLTFERGSEPFRAAVAKSKFKGRDRFGEAERGHILLQDHGGGIAFRNIEIRVIDS